MEQNFKLTRKYNTENGNTKYKFIYEDESYIPEYMNIYQILEILVNKYKKIIEIREIFDSNNLNNYRHYYICMHNIF